MYKESGHQSSIKHILSPLEGNISDVLRHLNSLYFEHDFNLPDNLLELGAVYLNKKRAHSTDFVVKNDYLRIHTQPKRFKTQSINFSDRIILNTHQFVVFNKPGQLPTHATVDNAIENTINLLEKHLHERLFITHRLDQETEGLIVFAKNQKMQSVINSLFKKKLIYKYYTAISSKNTKYSVPQGRITHFMRNNAYSPKDVTADKFYPNDLICEMDILNYNLVNETIVFQIQLITGRTHQIRSQLAQLGYPIIGDKIYNTLSDQPLQLKCNSIICDSEEFKINCEIS